jgi:hypothetical protein
MLDVELRELEDDADERWERRMTHWASARPFRSPHSAGMRERMSLPRPGTDEPPPKPPGATLSEEDERVRVRAEEDDELELLDGNERTRVRVLTELYDDAEDGRE